MHAIFIGVHFYVIIKYSKGIRGDKVDKYSRL